MGVYIVKTGESGETMTQKKEPYKTFLKKYHMLIKDEIWDSKISIDLTQGSHDKNSAFTIDRFYFSEPEMCFSFFNLTTNTEQINKCLISHVVKFKFDSCFEEAVRSFLASLKSRQEYIYIRDAAELEIRYDVKGEESAELVINAVIEGCDNIEAVCLSLISFDIAFFSANCC